MGRVWNAFFVLPYPNTRAAAVGELQLAAALGRICHLYLFYRIAAVSGTAVLLPDLATLRDRAKLKWRKMHFMACCFWLDRFHQALAAPRKLSLVLAGLSTPLVLSVHTIVSFDFATSVIPGWHTTIFPPYFVAGAIFSGFAMVQTLLLVTRKVLGLEEYITLEHIEVMNKVIVLTGSIVGIAYLTELFMAWYSHVNMSGLPSARKTVLNVSALMAGAIG
jgi:Ni/Fe-hydrogenase subunit HybB-like protein